MDAIERYQILDELGRGGMGVVYRARDMQLGREVALKLLPVALTQDKVVLRRFQQEAQLVAQLEHPHIVPIHDVGVRQDQPFIVMRLLRGGSLYDKLHSSQISPAQLWQLLHQVALALDTTHAQLIIHRDIKPTNILFDEQGQAYLTDFGIAKALDATTHYTGNAVVGSPAYMSPEQFAGQEQIDGRSDQYSLAVVAFEALAGQLPFQGNTVNMMYGHLHEPPPAIHTLNPHLPAIVNEVLQKALAKTAADRFPSVLAFVETLQKAAENAPTPIQPVSLAPVLPAPRKTQAAPLTTTTTEKRQLFYRQGLAALEEKRWGDAADSFRRVLELDPQHTNAKVRYEEAQSHLQGSASAAPSLPSSSTPVSPAITKGAGGVASTQSAPQPRWKWIAGAIGLLLLLVVAAGAISNRSEDEEVASAVLATQEIPTATNAAVLPTATTALSTPVAIATGSKASDSAPVDLEFVANIYTSRAEYNLQSFEELELLEGDLVVQAEGTAVIIQNRFGAQVELSPQAIAGVRYDSNNQQFAVHCLGGLCVVRGDVAGEVTLRAGQAVVVGGNGSPGNVFPAQNELFVDIARGVVPTPTATPRATATPTPTHTPTPRPTFTATPKIPTATSTSVPAPQPVQPQPQPTAVPPTAEPPPPEPPTAEPTTYYPYPYP